MQAKVDMAKASVSSIKIDLDRIIMQFWTMNISYSEAMEKIDSIINERTSETKNYKELISIGEARINAVNRLKRRQEKLEKLKLKSLMILEIKK